MTTNPRDGQLDKDSNAVEIGRMEKPVTEVERLAASLVELAKLDAGLDVVDRDLRLARETIGGHMELKNVLNDASLPVDKKHAVIKELFHDRISNTTLNFLQLLIGLDRAGLIGEIADEFADRLEAEENKVVAEVTTASEMDGEFQQKLARRLSEIAGREVTIRSSVDPSLLGGVVVRIGGQLIDGSVRNQLARVREKMLTDMRGK